ncbi:MAG: hypothetical protein WC393_04445 [Candidatus Nanoarchaeia archaeon]|jgi:hypothetical protein
MINITKDNMQEFAFEDEGDFESDLLFSTPEIEAEQLIDYYEQKYGFKKIAG